MGVFRVGVVVAIVLCCASGARAAPVDDVESARDHFAKGKRLYDLGRFADAASEYELAYQAKDDPALLFNIGQAYRLARQSSRALLAYKAYLRNVPDAANRAEVETWIRDLEASGSPAAARPPVVLSTKPPSPGVVTPLTTVSVAAPKPRRSIARKPWFWAAIIGGAAVVATGIAVGVVYGRRDPSPSVGAVTGP